MPVSLTCSQGHRWEVEERVRSTTCPICTEPLSVTATQETITREPSASDDGFQTLAHDSVRVSAAGVQIPGYELREELGRGGMGVVFQAR